MSSPVSNPYAPPLASVRDIAEPRATAEPADRSSRLGAAILDMIIFSAMVYVPLLFVTVIGPAAAEGEIGNPNADVLLVMAVALTLAGFGAWLWITIKHMRRNGQSIAKKLLGIKVVRADGSPATLGRLIWLRNILNGLMSIVPLYGLVDSLFIFGESRQCLHDKIADTIVVKA